MEEPYQAAKKSRPKPAINPTNMDSIEKVKRRSCFGSDISLMTILRRGPHNNFKATTASEAMPNEWTVLW